MFLSRGVLTTFLLGLWSCSHASPAQKSLVDGSPADVIAFKIDEQTGTHDPQGAADVESHLIRADGSISRLGSTGFAGAVRVAKTTLRHQTAVLFTKEGFSPTIWRIDEKILDSFRELALGILKPVAVAEVPTSPNDDTKRTIKLEQRGFLKGTPPNGGKHTCIVRELAVDGRSGQDLLILVEKAKVWVIRRNGRIEQVGETNVDGRIAVATTLLQDSVFLGASSDWNFDGGWLVDPALLTQYSEINLSLAPFFVH